MDDRQIMTKKETTIDEDIQSELECFLKYQNLEIAKSYTSYAMWRYYSRRSREEVEKYERNLIKKYPQLSLSEHELLRERALEVMGERSLVKG